MRQVVWIPEHPRLPLYRAAQPTREGKMGEVANLVTADAGAALHFETKAECEAWIAANPHPVFLAREHGFMEAP